MVNYDIRTLQLHILDIMKEVDSVCREHGLRYYIWAGTMLGAIRHKGFIPWDDDMDICMPRPDYELLMQHAHEWLPKPYEAICHETTPTYPGAFGKILNADTTLIEREHSDYLGGIYIDVFPIDGMPKSRIRQWWLLTQYELLDKLIYFLNRNPYKHGHGPNAWFVLMIQHLFSREWAQHRILQLRLKYDYNEAALVLDYDDGQKGIMDKGILGTPTPVEFEGLQLMGVEQWDKYLTKKYGDYMTIPPGDKRRQHNFFYLDYHLPYCQYHDTRTFRQNGRQK